MVLYNLENSFDFNTYEQGAEFVEKVGKFAEANGHHPEWRITNGGTTVEVSLTTHWNNNKLTIDDFELAKHMNQVFKGGMS